MLVAVGSADGGYLGVRVYDLPGGTLLERHDEAGRIGLPAVVDLGGPFLVVGRRERWVCELIRYAGGQPHVLRSGWFPMAAAAHPAGFVMLEKLQPRRLWRLGLCDTAGAVLSDSQVDLGWDIASLRLDLNYTLDADPVSGRLLVSGVNGLSVLTADGSAVLAAAEPSPAIDAACFAGPGIVAVSGGLSGDIRQYRIAGGQLELQASVPCEIQHPHAGLISIRHRGEIAVISGSGRVMYVDAQTLAEKSHPDELGGAHGTELWGSADGRCQALGLRPDPGRQIVRVIRDRHQAVRELAARPMGTMTPGDLETANAAKSSPVPGTATRPFLELLCDCLELRFAADVGLGGARAGSAGDDIGLAG